MAYAEVAAVSLLAVALRGESMMCKTPFDKRTSDWTITAVAVPFSPEPGIPTVTKLPVELETNVYGSPAAEVKLREVLNRRGE